VKTTPVLIALLLIAAAGVGGYLLGTRSHAPGAQAVATAASGAAPAGPAQRRILYYRNPMGLPDTSPTPKKDSMGMDYIPVYADEQQAAADSDGARQIRISTEKVQKLGVRTEPAAMRVLGRSVRAAGRVEPDERRIAMISPKFEGYVERLHVNATGQAVARGEALFEVYSPELVSAQREYLVAVQGLQALGNSGAEAQAGMKQLADASLARLRNWDLSPDDVAALVRSGEARRTITLRSPVAGIVTEKKAFQGMRFMPGEALYQVTDLSSIWVIADVAEQDIAQVRVGAKAAITLAAYPEQRFDGRVTFIYPTLKPETRTVPVRIELPNPRQRLKPAMFADVEFELGRGAPVLTVPDSAVIDTGTRQLVLVQRSEGRFEPREVKLGQRGDHYDEVLAGVNEGEQVVVAANFLIDAESNLRAAIGSFGGDSGQGGPAAASAVGHQGRGTVADIDPKAGVVSLSHEPIASLNWPAMTMDFKVANPSLLAGLKPGMHLGFEFVQRQPGEWVITSITPDAAKPAARSGQ
jgi:RND family efflux transporter MFP subunit